MSTPGSLIDLLAMQSPDVRLNALLENYLVHHADSPIRPIVEQAIASSNLLLKTRVLVILTT
jgi:hypothetical protein